MYITQPDDFSRVPPALVETMGKMEFVMELELSPERKLVSEDTEKVMELLEEKGFFVQMPRTESSFN